MAILLDGTRECEVLINEAEQLLYAPFAIAPNPTVDGREHPIKSRGTEVSQWRMHDGHSIYAPS